MIPLGEALKGGRFLANLAGFLRRPITLTEAQATLQHRLDHRGDDFLRLALESLRGAP